MLISESTSILYRELATYMFQCGTVKSGPLIYKGSTAKKYKKSNILSFYLLFASIERGVGRQ
jgi:hypothetical protein